MGELIETSRSLYKVGIVSENSAVKPFLLAAACAATCFSRSAVSADLVTNRSFGNPAPLAAPVASNVFIHLGPAGLILDEGAKIKTAGTRLPGATIKIAPQVTAALEIGYFVTQNIALALTTGIPPKATFDGAGTVAALGKLASVLYGPTALTGQYHFTNFGAVQPYVGVGPAYMIVFSEKDAAVSDFRLRSAWGVVGQIGADIMVTDRWGVFVDLKKAYLRTEARGSLGFTPLSAVVRLDPLVLSGGVTYRF